MSFAAATAAVFVGVGGGGGGGGDVVGVGGGVDGVVVVVASARPVIRAFILCECMFAMLAVLSVSAAAASL